MYKIPANTLFIGKQVLFVPECHSTNTLAMQMSQTGPVTEGTVFITNNQTAGKGQRGNTWKSAAGMNLTFSVILTPAFLDLKDQHHLSMIISLALCDFLATKTVHPVAIKWPNDILVRQKKISGILIENQVQSGRLLVSVAGIGFNINQETFQQASATSLKIVTGKVHELELCLHQILGSIEMRYLQLRQQKLVELHNDYLSRLYRLNEQHLFSSQDKTFEGVIRGIDGTGKLEIETQNGLKFFGIKEVSFIH